VAKDFQEIRIVDLGGDVRANPKLSGTTHNVFGIQTGVAIAFLVRKKGVVGSTILYGRRPEIETAEDKLLSLSATTLSRAAAEKLKPNESGEWINQLEESDWPSLVPIADKKIKSSKSLAGDRAIFKLYSLGVKTNRDDWAVAHSESELFRLYNFTIEHYSDFLKNLPLAGKLDWQRLSFDQEIKWTRKLRKLAAARTSLAVRSDGIVPSLYRPFSSLPMTFVPELNEDQYQLDRVIVAGQPNPTLMLNGYPSAKPAQALATDLVWHHDTLDKTNGLPRFRWLKSGERIDNITDWALNKFSAHYGKKGMSKDAIFAYCYAVLHDPVYREKYALNLKREFPRIPFYPDFPQWAAWGEALMKLHIDYEQVEPFALQRIETPAKRATGTQPKPVLKSNPENGSIMIDADTQLTGIPPEAWEYRLGNRSGIDWVLDQHKEKKPRDPTIAAKFNTYRFADYKEPCIGLLARVVTVSLETVKITTAMGELDRAGLES
jgi:predicted helicase